ncbi:MAG: FtsX-like permease family protein [Lachnospiraceae bacterium]|nr:FtsX-like permease family protein [Lachnospiraceae bacterium]
MKVTKSIAYKNIIKRPLRSGMLIILAAFLSFSVFAGTMITDSLKRGFNSLKQRLGADIMVVPYEATMKTDLSNIVLQGNTGYFYMSDNVLDKVAKMDGVGQISAQFFLASTSSGCCSLPVQIIGYDPETDFTITPWIKKSYGGPIDYLDVVVGNDLNAFVGDELSFYGVKVRIAAKLDKTGTTYDTAVFTNKETIVALIKSSLDKKMNEFADIDPDKVVSCILVNVADDYVTEEVLNDINIHVKKVKAIQTKNMISGISDSLSAVSDVTGGLMVAVWILALVIMVVAFFMMINERKKEFAVLRVLGASRKKLSSIVMKEGLMLALCGSVLGTLIGLVIIIPFNGFIENKLNLPFLLPGVGMIITISLLSVFVSALFGALTSAWAAYRISRLETGTILREVN